MKMRLDLRQTSTAMDVPTSVHTQTTIELAPTSTDGTAVVGTESPVVVSNGPTVRQRSTFFLARKVDMTVTFIHGIEHNHDHC